MSKKEELLEKAYDLAYRYEAERGSCPQCVYSAIMEALDIGNPATVQASDGVWQVELLYPLKGLVEHL